MPTWLLDYTTSESISEMGRPRDTDVCRTPAKQLCTPANVQFGADFHDDLLADCCNHTLLLTLFCLGPP